MTATPPGERIADQDIQPGDKVRIGDTWHEVSACEPYGVFFTGGGGVARDLPGLYAIRPAPPEPGPEVLALRHEKGRVLHRNDDNTWGVSHMRFSRAVADGYTDLLGRIGKVTP